MAEIGETTVETEDIDKRVKQYILVREAKEKLLERHKKELGELLDIQDTLSGILEAFLLKTGVSSAKTQFGTFYRATRVTASVTDGETFMKHIIDNQAWDLIERRANSTAAQEYVKEHNHPPPGVNLTQHTSIGVRRPTQKGDKDE